MDEATPTNAVIWRVDERGVAYITLNRPQVYNAYNGDLIAALLTAFDKLASEPLRAAVITGAGRNFQAGADVKWLDIVRRAPPQDNLRTSRMTAEAIQRLNTLPIPTVALVQGACFGGGTGIIAACDIVIAADNAKLRIDLMWERNPMATKRKIEVFSAGYGAPQARSELRRSALRGKLKP